MDYNQVLQSHIPDSSMEMKLKNQPKHHHRRWVYSIQHLIVKVLSRQGREAVGHRIPKKNKCQFHLLKLLLQSAGHRLTDHLEI